MSEKRGADQARAGVARTVRAVAAASRDEAGFVRRARGSGLLVRPRYAAGGTAAVVGYSVAARPVAGEPVVWFGGGRLDRDLTLPRLREAWPQAGEQTADVVAAWAGRVSWPESEPVAAAGIAGVAAPVGAGDRGTVEFPDPGPRPRPVPDPEWAATRAVLEGLRRDGLAREVGDTAGWVRSARDTAGLFAAMSARVEGAAPGPLARTADQLARVSQHRAARYRPGARGAGGGGDGVARAARYLMRSTGESGEDRERRERETELLQALMAMAGAVGAALEAAADRRQSRALLATVYRDLADVYAEDLTAARTRTMARIHTSLDQRRATRAAPAPGQGSGSRPTPPPPTQSRGRGR